METIFGSSMATGRFALGSSEPLGVNHADSVAAKRAVTTKVLQMSKQALIWGMAARQLKC
jgi:hypothetical protein